MSESSGPDWFGRVFRMLVGGFVVALVSSMAFTQLTSDYFHPGSKSHYVFNRTENTLEVIVIVVGVIVGCIVGALIPGILSWLGNRAKA